MTPEAHHPFCNYFMKPREGCSMCEKFFEQYPIEGTPFEMVKRYFPDTIIKSETQPTHVPSNKD